MKSKRILILEDDLRVAEVFALTLRGAGHEVVVCNSFEQGRSELMRSLPDALLTDIRLGQYNGLQLAILYRSLVPEGIVVAVSGHDDPVIRRETDNLGAEFLTKPVSLESLKAVFATEGNLRI